MTTGAGAGAATGNASGASAATGNASRAPATRGKTGNAAARRYERPNQLCVRCGALWAISARPMQWCPRCHGVLLAPSRPDAPPTVRGYRWVARRPGAGTARRDAEDGGSRPIPRYASTPQWGLTDPPPRRDEPETVRGAGPTPRLTRLLVLTAAVFGLACIAEIGRYAVLLRNRTRLIEPALLIVSDVAVWVTSIAGLLVALLAAIGGVGWLTEARRAAFARVGRSDPRPPFTLLLGCLVPVLNLVYPGVFLTELARLHGPRLQRAVRIWWGVWIAGAALTVAALAWRTADSLQAQADGVVVTAWADAGAAIVALTTLWLIRLSGGHDLWGHRRAARRWVAATGPARAQIEPVGRARTVGDTAVAESEAQEVMAK